MLKRSKSTANASSKSFLDDGDSDSSEEEFQGSHQPGKKSIFAMPKKEPKKKVGNQSTMVDMFLQGDAKQNAARQVEQGVVKFIPDPPGVDDAQTIKKKRKKFMKHLQSMLLDHQKAQVKQALEAKVQEYWKHFALWPKSWPETQEAREMQNMFADEFQQYSQGTPDAAGVTKADAVVSRSFKTFVCVATSKVGIRNCPTMEDNPAYMTGKVLRPGQVVIAENVIVLEDERYIKLSPNSGGGWVFEFKGDIEVMAELTAVETGLWWYRVACTEFVEVRQVPSYSRKFGTGYVMCPHEVCTVSLRANMFGSNFCQLADGRGWVFLMKSQDALQQNQGASPVVMEQADHSALGDELASFDLDGDGQIDEDELEAAMLAGMDTSAKGAVESGLWQYQVLKDPILSYGNTMNGSMLMPNESFAVDLRAPASGKKTKEVSASKANDSVIDRVWLRLYDGRGWIPKNDIRGKPLVRFTGSGNAKKPKQPKDVPPKDAWMYGTA